MLYVSGDSIYSLTVCLDAYTRSLSLIHPTVAYLFCKGAIGTLEVGPKAFYANYFIGSVCPLGFVKDGKNINYYDDKLLQEAVEPFIIDSIERQLLLPVNRDRCLCIGGEKNFRYLSGLNQRFRWFNQIIPLPHPRFIMQYKSKSKQFYIDKYVSAFHDAMKKVRKTK